MKKIFFAASLAFLALAWAVDADANSTAGVTYCSSQYDCGYVGTDGKVYNWNNGVVVTSGTAKSVFGLDGGNGQSWSTSASSPFTINGGSLSGLSFTKSRNWKSVAGIFLSGSTSTFCLTYACYPGSNKTNVADFDVAYGVSNYSVVVYNDGTSDACSGNNNVAIWNSFDRTTNRWICKKSDGSYESNHPNFTSLPAGIKEIASENDDNDSAAFLYVKSDNTLGGINHTVPSGTWRDVRLYSQAIGCGVSRADNMFRCWNNGTIFKNGTVAVENTQPPEPEPTAGPSGANCRNVTIPNTSTIEWMDPGFFSIPGSSTSFSWSSATSPIPSNCTNSSVIQWAGGTKCGDVGTLTQTDGTNNDRVTVYNYFTGSNLVADSFTASGTSRSLLIRDDDTGVPVIKFNAMRDGVPYAANVWQFFGVQNPSAFKNWAFEIGADGSSVPVFATGSQATVLYGNGRSSVVLQLNDMAVAPRGMRIGKASGNVTKTQCESATTACEWTQATLTGALACTSIPKNGKIGQCSDQNGICAPTATGTTTPIEGAYVTYGPNGEVLAVTPPQEFKNPDGTLRSADIYSCPNTPPGFANWIDCLLEVGGNVTDLLTQGTSQLTGEGSGSVVGIAQKIGNSAGELSLTGVAPTGANLADDVFRRTWNESFVGTENSPFRGFGVFALVISVILIIIAVIGAIGLAASKR